MRRFALLILLSVLPAFAAVETTTVNGKVVLSDGSAATAGSITCTLSAPGTALDGSTSQRVAGSDAATIGSDGTITGLTLVPNDAITPSGTTYKCTFSVSSPRRASWDETWSVATSPDPVNVGSITRHNVAPGITVGSFLLYVTNEPSGSCTSGETPRQATATGKTCACSAGTWSCVGGGNVLIDTSGDGGCNGQSPVSNPAPAQCWDTADAALYCSTGSAWVACNPGATPAGSTGDVQIGSGGALASAVTGTALDLDGNGSAGSADLNVDGTPDELGAALGNVKASSLFLPTVNGSTGSVHASALLSARAHASLYGDADFYLAPAMWGQWGETFLGRAMANTALNENSWAYIGACFDTDSDGTFTDNCSSGNSSNLCVSDNDGTAQAGGVDTDGDGTIEIVAGDVIYFGGTVDGFSHPLPTYFRTYAVQATAVGTGTGDCPNTTVKVTIRGYLPLATAPLTVNTTRVARLYLNSKHPTQFGQYLNGAKFASAQRALWGQQGPNLLRNAELAGPRGDAVDPAGWDFDATANVDVTTWPGTSPAGGTTWWCITGQTAVGDCWRHSPASTGYFQTEDFITVTASENYVVSAYVDPTLSDPGDFFSLLYDLGDDGTLEEGSGAAKCSIPLTGWVDSNAAASRAMSWFYCILTVPDGVSRVKLRYTKNSASANLPGIDQIEFRRYTGLTPDTDGDGTNDSGVEAGQYLVNDPGSRVIVFTGDSWAEPVETASEKYGDMFLDGMNAVLSTRFGRSIRAQMKATGNPGDTIQDLITNFYTRVEKYNPLYCIYSIGVNDVSGSTTVSQWRDRLRTLVAKTQAIGCIPIFVGIPPAATDNNSTYWSKIYSFHDAQLRLLRNWSVK